MLTIEGIVPQQPRKYLSYIDALRSKYEILDTFIVSEGMSGRAKTGTDGKKGRGMHLFLFMIDNTWATCKNFKWLLWTIFEIPRARYFVINKLMILLTHLQIFLLLGCFEMFWAHWKTPSITLHEFSRGTCSASNSGTSIWPVRPGCWDHWSNGWTLPMLYFEGFRRWNLSMSWWFNMTEFFRRNSPWILD